MSVNTNVPVPQGKYRPAVRQGGVIYVSGMTPRKDGALIMTGKVFPDRPTEDYRVAAEQAAENALAAARSLLREGERLERVLTMTVFIAAADGFSAFGQVADLASDYLEAELGEGGRGCRTTVGVADLPGGAPLEVQLTLFAV